RSATIVSVHNLYPYWYEKNPACHQLYTGFYSRAEVIHHLSQTSKDWVCREYPSVARHNHVVRSGYNYERLLPSGPRDRVAARRAFGFAPDQTVFLVFGALRLRDQGELLRRAFARAKIPNKRLLLKTNYVGWLEEGGSIWRRRLRRWQWQRWRASDGVRWLDERIPDEKLSKLFDAVDAVVVIRNNSLGS